MSFNAGDVVKFEGTVTSDDGYRTVAASHAQQRFLLLLRSLLDAMQPDCNGLGTRDGHGVAAIRDCDKCDGAGEVLRDD